MPPLSNEDPTVIPTSIPNDATQGAAPGPYAAAGDECQLMAELSIIRDGRQYLYDGYCYDRLSDAVAYAQLGRGQTPAEALRRAKLRLRADPRWNRPALWAGYVLVGRARAWRRGAGCGERPSGSF